MEIIKFNLTGDWNDIDERVIQEAIDTLKQGNSIIFPTDTVYGLGVNALDIHSVKRLFKMKKRPETKPVPIMVKDIEMAKKLAYVNPEREKILKSIWPGQVTAVLERRDALSEILTAGKRSIGMRIPEHPFTRYLMENLDFPVTCTSANLSGDPPLISSQEVIKTFERAYPRPTLILDAGDLPESPPSSVLDLTRSQPRITRVGPITKKDLMKLFK